MYLKALWLKKSYSFNWAHKPLCYNYREDVITLGHVHLCRSCLCAYLGVLSGLTVPVILPEFFGGNSKVILIILMTLTLPLSHPFIYKHLHRRVRDLLRFSLGMLLAIGSWVALTTSFPLGLGALLLCFIVWKIYYKKRAIKKIELCLQCEEYSENYICSGYIHQSQCIREYEEKATEYLLKSGYRPNQFR